MKKLKWMDIITKYHYFLGIFIYVNDQLPLTLQNNYTLVRNHHHYKTRSASSDNIVLPLILPKTKHWKHNSSYTGSAFWNSIPISIRKCTSLQSFKFQFKRHPLAEPVRVIFYL